MAGRAWHKPSPPLLPVAGHTSGTSAGLRGGAAPGGAAGPGTRHPGGRALAVTARPAGPRDAPQRGFPRAPDKVPNGTAEHRPIPVLDRANGTGRTIKTVWALRGSAQRTGPQACPWVKEIRGVPEAQRPFLSPHTPRLAVQEDTGPLRSMAQALSVLEILWLLDQSPPDSGDVHAVSCRVPARGQPLCLALGGPREGHV